MPALQHLVPQGTRPSGGVLIKTSHALGHAAIDADHFALAARWLECMHCTPIALSFAIARFRRLMREHFAHEAALVEASGHPFCRSHSREHDTMLTLCDEAFDLALRNWRPARSLLRRKLPPLVREHIVTMDQVAVLIINTAADEAVVRQPGR
jgi:hemerythrin